MFHNFVWQSVLYFEIFDVISEDKGSDVEDISLLENLNFCVSNSKISIKNAYCKIGGYCVYLPQFVGEGVAHL